jgi:hypothetical protein
MFRENLSGDSTWRWLSLLITPAIAVAHHRVITALTMRASVLTGVGNLVIEDRPCHRPVPSPAPA